MVCEYCICAAVMSPVDMINRLSVNVLHVVCKGVGVLTQFSVVQMRKRVRQDCNLLLTALTAELYFCNMGVQECLVYPL